MHTIETMTEHQAEIAIRLYQRRKRAARNLDLWRGMRGLNTPELFLSALHALSGLNTEEREAVRTPKILQTLA